MKGGITITERVLTMHQFISEHECESVERLVTRGGRRSNDVADRWSSQTWTSWRVRNLYGDRTCDAEIDRGAINSTLRPSAFSKQRGWSRPRPGRAHITSRLMPDRLTQRDAASREWQQRSGKSSVTEQRWLVTPTKCNQRAPTSSADL